MHLTFLGTSSATPTRERNVSSCAVVHDDGETWIIDCGEGTQQQMLRTAIKPPRVRRVLLTHLHGDHCFGLFGLLASLGVHGSTEPVEVIGPRGVEAMLRLVLQTTQTGLDFPLVVRELDGEEVLEERGGVRLSAHPIQHRMPTFGYVLHGPTRRGTLDVARAKALGVPDGPELGALVRGEAVQLPGGATVEPSDVLGPARRGPHLVVLGDTSEASAMAEHCMDCDVLVHEATYAADREAKALEWGHSTTLMAARFAARVRARTLVLTHFSARYTSTFAKVRVEDLVREAQEGCPGTQVVAAHDFLTLPVSAPDR